MNNLLIGKSLSIHNKVELCTLACPSVFIISNSITDSKLPSYRFNIQLTKYPFGYPGLPHKKYEMMNA